MAKITDAVVTLDGHPIAADCRGNNAAILCPRCNKRPLLLTAMPNHQGSDQEHPVKCPDCHTAVWMTSSVRPGTEVSVVTIAIG